MTVLYDGACPICRREVAWLRRRDRRARLAFVDIADAAFDPGRYGLTHGQVQAVMHVVLPDGRIARRIDAVRLIYRAIGLGCLVAPLGWPGLHGLFDRLYGLLARNRMRIGRLLGRECGAGACGVHGGKNE